MTRQDAPPPAIVAAAVATLVQEIVRRHDGAVAISEGPTGGTRVRMAFKPAHGTA